MQGIILNESVIKELLENGKTAIIRSSYPNRVPFIASGQTFYVKEAWQAHIYHVCGGIDCDCDMVAVTYHDGSLKTFWDSDIDSDWVFPKVCTIRNFPKWAARLFVTITGYSGVSSTNSKNGQQYEMILEKTEP